MSEEVLVFDAYMLVTDNTTQLDLSRRVGESCVLACDKSRIELARDLVEASHFRQFGSRVSKSYGIIINTHGKEGSGNFEDTLLGEITPHTFWFGHPYLPWKGISTYCQDPKHPLSNRNIPIYIIAAQCYGKHFFIDSPTQHMSHNHVLGCLWANELIKIAGSHIPKNMIVLGISAGSTYSVIETQNPLWSQHLELSNLVLGIIRRESLA